MNQQTNKNPTQKAVLPQVRYHPTIQTGEPARTRTGPTHKTRPGAQTGTKAVENNQDANGIAPEVRYHPTIQTGEPARTRTGKTHKTRPGAQTGIKAVQNNQDADGIAPEVQYHPIIQTGEPARTRTGQTHKTRRNNQDADRTGPADPEPRQKQEQMKEVDHRAATGPDLPTPDQVPLGLAVGLDRCVVEQVEVLTRGQSTNQDWFAWRKNRITASMAHRIAHCRFVHGKTKTPPPSYMSAITGEGRSIQTRAMSWGVQMEAEVVRRYQTLKTASLRSSVSVQDCGLFIDARRSWLAASPDGIVTDSRTGEWLLCLEVKCPYKHRHRRVEDACKDDPAFCLELRDEDGPLYRLKTSHSYFTQIQCQLAVTGLRRADLAVFTLKEIAIVPVTFDPNLWEETVSKLETFYRDAVLPRLREKTQLDTPEL
ncbi:uncharacterized protein LOC128360963 [Scomber japonicus]|uniref:uncharacterized protein LOC128360963 n=1 Tax=Scomber japonicus TaxID=13676 RepID=UPI00230665E5|nr:uncharacterized protein LOC128360963 [Scomber japonicus]